ncbi:MAG TPA: right-handed parallel beta-helix repeat-containing protein [Anaerolineales bacterium]|nr:right-handed parallel beta-helix repeat-containing protein [Anaerolineales bacterium]
MKIKASSFMLTGFSCCAGLVLALGILFSLQGWGVRAARAGTSAELTVCASGCDFDRVQDAALAANSGDVIKIAAGVYTGVQSISGSTQMVIVTKTLTLRGGYSPDFSVWDPALYTTTLDAEGQGRVVYASGAVTVTLDGLQMVNGYNNSSGAGVYAVDSTLYVLNSTIGNNRLAPHFNGNYGVGLSISNGYLSMQSSIVQGNEPLPGGDYSHDGGGLYAIESTVEISNSQFLSNTAAFEGGSCGTGGAIRLENCTTLIQGTTFRNNVATTCNGGGGGIWTRIGSLRLLDSTFEGNTNGGAVVQTPGALIEGNTFTGNTGNGLAIGSWGQPVVNITVTRNLLENNTATGLLVSAPAVSMIVEENEFIGNGNSGLKLRAKSDTGAATPVIVRDNLFEGNTTTANGGGAYLTGAVDVLFNRFIGNQAGGKGGGVYQDEYCSDGYSSYTCKDNASAVYDGNLFQGNSAAEGGGLYSIPKFSPNLNIAYRNMVFLENTVTGTGSALYFYRYENSAVPFEHLTVANNTGGDGAMIYHMMGNAYYTNTILYDGMIGISRQHDYVTLDHVLRYDVLTPTLNAGSWGLTDLAPITGTPAFAADGYHLTAVSAAVDAGAATDLVHDIDGQPRKLGSAPDIGADESPYSTGGSGMQISNLASIPEWKVYYTGVNVPPSTYLQQDYLIPFSYLAPGNAPLVTEYTIEDNFPASLDLVSVSSPQEMAYSQDGETLRWTSQASLAPGGWDWIGLNARSDDATGGELIVNTGQMSYTLANGNSATLPFSATIEVPERPVFPPLFITPLNGEMCLGPGNTLEAYGLAGVGMVVRIYEDGEIKGQTTAGETGEFNITWTSALTESHAPVNLTAVACEPAVGGTCSAPSDTVNIAYPEADWCPQRSYWEGDVFGDHYTFFFRNDAGRYATNDFYLPGVYGFWNTQIHLYSCCPHDTINPFKLKVDGVTYDDPAGHEGRIWTFNIGSAHEVIVESQCYGVGGAEGKPHTNRGEVLIDPDGFVFNSALGGSYSADTGMFDPVQAVPGITVTAYVSVPEWGGWFPWPAHLYQNQVNPQVTGSDGYFAFFTPPGHYYLQATGADGYQSWRSPVVEVITEIVHVNIPLTLWAADEDYVIDVTPQEISQPTLSIPAGSRVVWNAVLWEGVNVDDWSRALENPLLRLGSLIDPLAYGWGWDSGMLSPGQSYSRLFTRPGIYTYTDGYGHQGEITVVSNYRMVLPIVMRTPNP